MELTMTRILIASACLLFASAASATSPVTYSSGPPPTARISVADVDIGSAPGRAVVETRIRMAARKVCLELPDSSPIVQPKFRLGDCYVLATSSGISQLEQLAGK
jgi:UrcA family protein